MNDDIEKYKKKMCDKIDEISKIGSINHFTEKDLQTPDDQEYFEFKIGYKLNQNRNNSSK